MKLTKEEKSWVMYDWANSAYITIMVSAIFPIFFSTLCSAAGIEGDLWWGIASSAATAVVAVASPFLGALADFPGNKKRLFQLFLGVGLLFTLFCAFTENWKTLLVVHILSHIAYLVCNLLYDSFLTDVTTTERMDYISSLGYALGYIGGSTIPFLASIVLVSFGDRFGIGAALAIKLSVIITVIWWGLFSLPMLLHVKQTHGLKNPPQNLVREIWSSVVGTARDIGRNKGILFFILAYFFYIDGVSTVINMATSYGATLGLDTTGMVLALMVTQLVAVPFAILFGRLSRRVGALTMIFAAIIVYFIICVLGTYMGYGVEEGFLTIKQATNLFWLLAILVGTVQGGIQAISRSYYGKIIPPDKSGEYFGFFDIFGKFAAVMGPTLYAVVKGLTGRSSYSIFSIILLFLIASVIMIAGRKHMIKM